MNKNSASFPKRRVLILSYANWEGISRIPYLLSQSGFEVEVLAQPTSYIAHSNWISRLIPAPAELDALLKMVRSMSDAGELTHDWIIVGDDTLLCALGERRNESWARALLPCSGVDSQIDFIVSKVSFIKQASELGVAVPAFHLCDNTEQLKAAADALGWPLVVKQDEGFGGIGVTIASDVNALLNTDFSAGPVIAQAFVEGVTGSAAAIYDKGRLVCFFSYRRKRTWGKLGPSTAVEFRIYPELQEYLEKLGKLSAFHGLCGIEFIEDQATGKAVILEQNFRPTLSVFLGKRVGVDLMEILQRFPINHANPVKAVTQRDGHDEVPLFPGDVIRALDEGDLKCLLRWAFTPTWWKEMNWHDRRLVAYNSRLILARGRKRLSDFIRKKS